MALIYFPIALQTYLPMHPVALPPAQSLEQLLRQLGQHSLPLQQALWLGEQLHPALYLLLNQQPCSWSQLRQQQLAADDQLWIIQPLSGG
jgi:sulfur carrier protein ThiS